MAEAALHEVIRALEDVATTRYVSAAGFVMLLYDHVLTLDDEVEFIWSAPNTVAKILFLIMRYMVPLFMLGQAITRSGLAYIYMSDYACKVWTSFATYSGLVSIAISNFLVLLRIWTLLPRGHALVRWSVMFYIAMQTANVAVTTWVIVEMNDLPSDVLVFEPLVGLCTFAKKPNVVWLWVVGLAYEVVVFAVVAWNALARPRSMETEGEAQLLRMLFRDGLFYFVTLTVLRVSNTIISIVSPVSSLFVIVFFIWGSTTVTTSRLIINQRRARETARHFQREVLAHKQASARDFEGARRYFPRPSDSTAERVREWSADAEHTRSACQWGGSGSGCRSLRSTSES
ncbi:hypothetical protein MKEN_00535700 [Mycena kentingensis (nom. inval.)]|nr:hypothetical protein MKEN_00535700 [Mycena kentingensis (nom. inval.)]